MKKILLAVLATGFLASACSKVLYTHYDYDEVVYFYAKSEQQPDSKELKKLIKSYKQIVDNPKGENLVPPPGSYADYAYLLFLNKDVDNAKVYFQKEYVTYPESRTYVESVMRRLGL